MIPQIWRRTKYFFAFSSPTFFVLILAFCIKVASGLVGQDQAREAAGLVVDLIKVRHNHLN